MSLQISEGALDGRRRCEQWTFRVDPLTQGREQCAGKCFAFVGVNSAVGVAGDAVELVQLADETNTDERTRSVEVERLEEVAAGMCPAPHLDDVLVAPERLVIRRSGVGLQHAREAVEGAGDGVAVALGQVMEIDVSTRVDNDLKMPSSTAFRLANQNATCVGQQYRRRFRFGPHGLGDVLQQRCAALHPLAQRRARERHTLTAKDSLLPVQRQVVCVFVDEDLRQQTRPRQAFADGQLWCVGDGERHGWRGRRRRRRWRRGLRPLDAFRPHHLNDDGIRSLNPVGT